MKLICLLALTWLIPSTSHAESFCKAYARGYELAYYRELRQRPTKFPPCPLNSTEVPDGAKTEWKHGYKIGVRDAKELFRDKNTEAVRDELIGTWEFVKKENITTDGRYQISFWPRPLEFKLGSKNMILIGFYSGENGCISQMFPAPVKTKDLTKSKKYLPKKNNRPRSRHRHC